MRATCSVLGCDKPVVSNGLCDTHRKRLDRHGSTEQTRPKDWGTREKHPLYMAWTQMRRTGRAPICERWADFWKFVEDVGTRPEGAMLQRPNEAEPYGPTNFSWREPLKLVTNSSKEKAAYQRAWRKLHPERAKNSELLRQFGITYADYQRMFEAQGGLCAICNQPETSKAGQLAVDHDHLTGAVRGLLCSNCNRGIGCFKDDLDLLRKAMSYLEAHRAIETRQQ